MSPSLLLGPGTPCPSKLPPSLLNPSTSMTAGTAPLGQSWQGPHHRRPEGSTLPAWGLVLPSPHDGPLLTRARARALALPSAPSQLQPWTLPGPQWPAPAALGRHCAPEAPGLTDGVGMHRLSGTLGRKGGSGWKHRAQGQDHWDPEGAPAGGLGVPLTSGS